MNMFFGSPEEMVRAMQERAAHHKMHVQGYEHAETDFLLSLVTEKDGKLDSERLVFFRELMRRVQAYDWYDSYMLGRIDHLLVEVGVCTCGENHDDAIADLLKETPPTDAEAQVGLDHMPPAATQSVEMIDPANSPELLEEYGMEMGVSHNDSTPYLRCKNCKKPYVTMEDRMLKAPKEDGCDGCHQKSATGQGY